MARKPRTGFIRLRKETYYAILEVPKDLRVAMGKSVFSKSLKTDSPTIARERAKPHIKLWKAEIEKCRNTLGKGARIISDTQYWQNEARNAATPEARAFAKQQASIAEASASYWAQLRREAPDAERARVIEDQIFDKAWEIGAENVEHVGDDPIQESKAIDFHEEAMGNRIATDEYKEQWLAKLKNEGKSTTTLESYKTAVEKLMQEFPTLDKVTRIEVIGYFERMNARYAASTTRLRATGCRVYWKYLERLEVVPLDSSPFKDLDIKGKSESYEEFEPEEVVQLYNEAVRLNDVTLAGAIRIAAYTGCRISELCGLQKEDVDLENNILHIRKSKTNAGVREVPIAEDLRETLVTLIDLSGNGEVIPDTPHAIRTRFKRKKKRLGFVDKVKAMHSFRGTVVTQLERAGVAEGITQDIVGHERSTLTGKTYSGKSSMEQRREAIEKLEYPW